MSLTGFHNTWKVCPSLFLWQFCNAVFFVFVSLVRSVFITCHYFSVLYLERHLYLNSTCVGPTLTVKPKTGGMVVYFDRVARE